MPANFDPLRLRTQMFGVVDHPVGQPQQALLDSFQVVFLIKHFVASGKEGRDIDAPRSQVQPLRYV